MARALSNIVYLESPEKGVDGRGILSGARDPLMTDGRLGDFWINTVSKHLFGPKNAGEWPDKGLIRGAQGWAPKLVAQADGTRRVFKIDDWTGGEGAKPGTGYLAADGTVVADIADAADFRGEQGPEALINALDEAEDEIADDSLIATGEAASDNKKRTAVEVFDLGGELARKSIAHAQASRVRKQISRIKTQFFSDATGKGGAYYKRVNAQPTHGLCFRTLDRWTAGGNSDSANGGWWEIDEAAINLHMAGACGDGDTNDAAAITRAFQSGFPVVAGNGVFLINGETISAKHPLSFKGAGPGKTVFLFDNMGGFDGLDGIELDVTGSSIFDTTSFSNCTVKIIGGHGRNFLTTPRGIDARSFMPKYVLDRVTWQGDAINSLLTSEFAWKFVAVYGDGDHHQINACAYYGSYDPTAEPVGDNIRSGFLSLGGLPGEGGLGYPTFKNTRVLNCGRVVDFNGGFVARPKFEVFTVHNCWDGVISEITAAGSYPHEVSFIDCDINTQHRSIDFEMVSQLVAVASDATRAPDMYDHNEGWKGWRVGRSGRTELTATRAIDPKTTGTSYNTEHTGYDIRGSSVLIVNGAYILAGAQGHFDTGLRSTANYSADIKGVNIFGSCDDGLVFDGSAPTGAKAIVVGYHTNSLVTNKVVYADDYSRRNVEIVGEEIGTDTSTTTYTAAATVDVDPSVSQVKRALVNGGSGAFTVDFRLQVAKSRRNDEIWLNVNMGGANPTVRVLDHTGAVQLTLPPPGSGNAKKYSIYARLVGGGAGVWRIIAATESLA